MRVYNVTIVTSTAELGRVVTTAKFKNLNLKTAAGMTEDDIDRDVIDAMQLHFGVEVKKNGGIYTGSTGTTNGPTTLIVVVRVFVE